MDDNDNMKDLENQYINETSNDDEDEASYNGK